VLDHSVNKIHNNQFNQNKLCQNLGNGGISLYLIARSFGYLDKRGARFSENKPFKWPATLELFILLVAEAMSSYSAFTEMT
jgi:hypothetical protein